MSKDLFTYLRSYSTNPFEVDRLIVSAFLYSLGLEYTVNEFLEPYLIQENDKDHKSLLDFLPICQFTGLEELIQVFEFVISPEEKIVTGAVYTPRNIREYIVNQCFRSLNDLTNVKICDPACGCGGFLYTAAKAIHDQTGKTYENIFAENIYGLDIQKYAINRSKLLLTLRAITEGENADFEFNLEKGNALNFNWKDQYEDFKGFDAVVGNPPYVCSRNIDEESKELLKNWSVCSTGHPDLYIPFMELGMGCLNEGGILGYITMNTFFKSINGRSLRNYLSQFDNTIIDFGGNQVFDSKSTYTCICFVSKKPADRLRYSKLDAIDDLQNVVEFKSIDLSLLNHFDGWNLQEIELLTRIENIGIPLGEKFKTRNGIATLKNNVYIFNPVSEDEEFYYLQNGNLYPIEKGICTDIINSNKFTKVKCVDAIRQKVIFPYRFEGENVKLIKESEFKEVYPKAYAYLKDKRSLLDKRDKGNGKYEHWYAYGRNQSLEKMPNRLFFPHITANIPNFVINQEEQLLFYNGLALIAENPNELKLMKKLMGSRLFWFYVTKSSKPYGSGYYSLSRNYIKKFGIPEFTDEEINYLISLEDSHLINEFVDQKYDIDTSVF